MNKIYQGAWCTVIALDGGHADAGLAGISRSRRAQKQLTTASGIFLTTLPHILHELNTFKWTTRAWCYQEAILSPRSLVFTESQVYFVCKSSMAPEVGDSLPAVDSPGRQGIFTSTLMDPWWECVDSKRLSHAYIGHVWQYTSKDLQYDQGALAAFRGIVAAGVVDTVWDVGYSGMEFREIRRRKGFPTWSWLSLVARIALSHDDMHSGTGDLHYYSQFDIEVSANETKSVKDVLQELQPGLRMVETQAYGLRIYGPWFSAAVTNIQAAFTIIYNDEKSKARERDARERRSGLTSII
ncbi:hypothetical protein LTR70_006845 [Exophiala xenobiotica]|uniref:Heterokaryon incompatibility domain-containing protein n=1 Tax=Lithohypha guttulata TaxID=1690604 RepID=A0ABR0K6F4_9EURO|nr:hypothetical protein LTR24_006454 [Lithohypha guttulata]KAK5315192.1 hypothetical protein LTR70_006845 [Exophiala xenobiotica]